MDARCYILYSLKLDSFYIGSSELLPEERLELHNNKKYGSRKFTARSDDWKVFLTIECESVSQARKIDPTLNSVEHIDLHCSLNL